MSAPTIDYRAIAATLDCDCNLGRYLHLDVDIDDDEEIGVGVDLDFSLWFCRACLDYVRCAECLHIWREDHDCSPESPS